MIKCPNCGESHYAYHYSTTTAMGWTPIYKDGIEENGNPNISTSYCTCCECGHDFYYKEQYGKVIKIIDLGKKPEVPVLNVDINAHTINESTAIKAEDLRVMPSIQIDKQETSVTIPDMADIKEQITDIKKELDEIKKLIIKWVL